MNLDDSGDYWLETRQEAHDGRMVTVAKLHAAPHADASRDRAATEKACAMMSRLGDASPGQDVVHEVERAARVKRHKRPAARSLTKHFHA